MKLSAMSQQLSAAKDQGPIEHLGLPMCHGGLQACHSDLPPSRHSERSEESQRAEKARGPDHFGQSLSELLRSGRETLASCGAEEPAMEAEVLLMHALAISRAYLYTHREEPVTPADASTYRCLLERRAKHEPVAYITGHREFYGLDFYVDRRVLVPRPETELLVEEGLKLLKRAGYRAPIVADIGTGSGAIATAVACHLPEVTAYATDISPEALEVAARNCRRHSVEDRVRLLAGNLLEPLPGSVDMLVANLPYVPSDVLSTLAPDVAIYEPRGALEGGPDGLDLIRGLLTQAPGRLNPGGSLLMEIGADQGAAAARAAAESLPGAGIRVLRDLAGLDRVVVVELAA